LAYGAIRLGIKESKSQVKRKKEDDRNLEGLGRFAGVLFIRSWVGFGQGTTGLFLLVSRYCSKGGR